MAGLRWLTGILALLIASFVEASEPSLFDNQYSAKLYGFNILVTSRLSAHENGNYQFYFDAKAALGRITETSQFKWNEKDQQVVPLLYTYKRAGLGKSRDQTLNFDWAKHEVTDAQKGTHQVLDVARKVQDSLSYQVQLRQDLLAGKKSFHYAITNGKKFRNYKFEVAGEEVLETPLGKVTAVKVRRIQTSEDRETYAWFAKDFQYLLVRLQQEENGSAYTIYISKASLNGKAIEHF